MKTRIQLTALVFALSCMETPTAPPSPSTPAPVQIGGIWDWTDSTTSGCRSSGSYRFVQAGSKISGDFAQAGNACSGASSDWQVPVTKGTIQDSTVSFYFDAFSYLFGYFECTFSSAISGRPPSAMVGSSKCGSSLATWRAHPAGAVAAITIKPSPLTLVAGWTTRPLTEFTDAAGERVFFRTVTWSSDNHAVATIADAGGVTGIGLGTATVTATAGQTQRQTNVTVMSLDNFAITFDGMGGMEVLTADGAIRSTLIPPTEYLQPTWSPDGTRLALTRARNWFACSIYTIRADGSRLMRLSESYNCDHSPAWSPDGTKIAFGSGDVVCYDDCRVKIHVASADGASLVVLDGSESIWDSRPSWSPDGTKIAFESWDFSSNDYDIYVMNADGSGAVNLTHRAGNDTEAKWAPDGTLAFAHEGDIWVMQADGSGATNLTANLGFESNPAWSPDGSKIVFVSSADNWCTYPDPQCWHAWSDLYVMNRDGSDVQRLTNGEFYVAHPVFRSSAH